MLWFNKRKLRVCYGAVLCLGGRSPSSSFSCRSPAALELLARTLIQHCHLHQPRTFAPRRIRPPFSCLSNSAPKTHPRRTRRLRYGRGSRKSLSSQDFSAASVPNPWKVGVVLSSPSSTPRVSKREALSRLA